MKVFSVLWLVKKHDIKNFYKNKHQLGALFNLCPALQAQKISKNVKWLIGLSPFPVWHLWHSPLPPRVSPPLVTFCDTFLYPLECHVLFELKLPFLSRSRSILWHFGKNPPSLVTLVTLYLECHVLFELNLPFFSRSKCVLWRLSRKRGILRWASKGWSSTLEWPSDKETFTSEILRH